MENELPCRSVCKCQCHATPGMLHMFPCCRPDPPKHRPAPGPVPDSPISGERDLLGDERVDEA